MNLIAISQTFKNGLIQLEEMVRVIEVQVIGNSSAPQIIANNVNFFTKSFLISACAHLEMCIKEIIFEVSKDIDSRLAKALIPSSVVEWRYSQKKKGEQLLNAASFLSVAMTKKEIDDLVSGNVYKTKDALAVVGVDLTKDKDKWDVWKDLIQGIVTRRNNIVHHNDNASDISLGDIRGYIKSILEYIDFIVFSCVHKI